MLDRSRVLALTISYFPLKYFFTLTISLSHLLFSELCQPICFLDNLHSPGDRNFPVSLSNGLNKLYNMLPCTVATTEGLKTGVQWSIAKSGSWFIS